MNESGEYSRGKDTLLRYELERHVRECQTDPCDLCQMFDRVLADERRTLREKTLRIQSEADQRKEWQDE